LAVTRLATGVSQLRGDLAGPILNGGSGLRISDQMPCLTVNFELATAVFPGTGWIKTEHSPANDGFDGNDVPVVRSGRPPSHAQRFASPRGIPPYLRTPMRRSKAAAPSVGRAAPIAV